MTKYKIVPINAMLDCIDKQRNELVIHANYVETNDAVMDKRCNRLFTCCKIIHPVLTTISPREYMSDGVYVNCVDDQPQEHVDKEGKVYYSVRYRVNVSGVVADRDTVLDYIHSQDKNDNIKVFSANDYMNFFMLDKKKNKIKYGKI